MVWIRRKQPASIEAGWLDCHETIKQDLELNLLELDTLAAVVEVGAVPEINGAIIFS